MHSSNKVRACTYPAAASLLAGVFAIGLPSSPATAETAASFATALDIPISATVRDIALGDINGDGDLDLVTANDQQSNVQQTSIGVALGDGDGNFGTPADYATTELTMSVAVGDLDGDGRTDIVATTDTKVAVWLTQPNGQPGPVNEITVGAFNDGLAVGDVDGDGFLDIAVGAKYGSLYSPEYEVLVLSNDGTGDFGSPSKLSVPTSSDDLALSDLDSDGNLDIVATGSDSGSFAVSTRLGNGSGSFAPAQTSATDSATRPHGLATGDLNGDEFADLVVGSNFEESPKLSVMLSNGNGTFATAVPLTAGDLPESVALGDINGDGYLDILAADRFGGEVETLLGTGVGTFGAPVGFATSPNPNTIALGDLNNDGRLDIATGDRTIEQANSLLNTSGYTPTVTVKPKKGPTTGGTAVTITGTNLSGATSVEFGGRSARAINVVSDTEITAKTPSGSAGLASVSVGTPDVAVTTSSAFRYRIPQTLKASSLPKKLKPVGKTVLNKARAKTKQGRPLTANVTTRSRVLEKRGDIWCLQEKDGRKRKVSVVLSGQCKLKVLVTYTAKGSKKYEPLTYTKKYKTKRVV